MRVLHLVMIKSTTGNLYCIVWQCHRHSVYKSYNEGTQYRCLDATGVVLYQDSRSHVYLVHVNVNVYSVLTVLHGIVGVKR